MASKQARGTKRTCQNSECGARFYDLGHTPIVCPVCETVYVIASSPMGAAVLAEEKPRPRAKKADFVADEPEVAAEPEGDEALADIGEAEETIEAEEDETFLEEEEEEGGDLANVIGGPVEGDEEP